MKKLILLFCTIFLLTGTYGQTWQIEPIDEFDQEVLTWDIQNNNQCIQNKYELSGKFNVKKNKEYSYSVQTQQDISLIEPQEWFVKIYKNWDEIFESEGLWTNYKFEKVGQYEIFVYIREEQWCQYQIWEKINVFEKIFFYIWKDIQQLDLVQSSYEDKSIFLKKAFVPEKTLFLEDEFFQIISEDISYFVDAEKIIINTSNFPSIFEFLWKLANLYQTELNQKDIFLITDTNTNYIKRILAQYINKINVQNIFIVKNDYLIRFMDALSYENFQAEQKHYIHIFSVTFQDIQTQYFLSYIVDFLIYNEFPINLLWVIITLAVAALIVTIFRQIIGFSVFGVYNPILFAVSMLVLWIEITFSLLFIWLISTLLINLFTSKIYLLYSAKISLLMIVYFLITFLVFWLDNFLGLYFIDYTVFSNSFIIFPVVFLIIVSNKVFGSNFSLFSKWWWVSFLEFLTVSLIIYFLLTWPNFQFFMLSYPDILFLIVILNILVGRFTWLQLLEYLRFMPLLKYKWEEEEEE